MNQYECLSIDHVAEVLKKERIDREEIKSCYEDLIANPQNNGIHFGYRKTFMFTCKENL